LHLLRRDNAAAAKGRARAAGHRQHKLGTESVSNWEGALSSDLAMSTASRTSMKRFGDNASVDALLAALA